MTSNYYKSKDLSAIKSFDTIVKGIQTNTPNISVNWFKGMGLSTVEKTFNSSINETPNTLGYIYDNTDISNYCIAPYVESSGTTYSSIPDWCTKIRAILVGGGGKGGTGLIGTSTTTPAVQYNIAHYYYHNFTYFKKYKNYSIWNNPDSFIDSYEVYTVTDKMQYQYVYVHHNIPAVTTQTSTGSGGGGGGGGAFLYLDNITLQGSVSVTKGGPGGSTTLTIGTTTYTANKGANASGSTKGSGGAASAHGTIKVKGNDGNDPSGSTAGAGGTSVLSTYTSVITTSYGKGSEGTDGRGGGDQPPAAGNGNDGYYRIYFLTN